MIFQCKNCGGNVIYSPEKKKMYCPYCDSEESQERKDKEGEITVCPNCGGEVLVEEHTSATRCPYCDNYIIFNERVEGEFQPDLIIPFQYGKESVKKLMREKFAKCIFAPTDFLSEVQLDKMEGDYIPFWLYDYDVNCQYQGEGRKIRVWVSGETEYTETSFYDVQRDMDVNFRRIPADASNKMPDDIMDLMEPYQYDQLEAFMPEYLSGFYGEKYNIPKNVTEPRARQKMEDGAARLLQESIAGYSSISQRSRHIGVEKENQQYGLLPVWVYSYQYKNQKYPFYINGQTAKIVGRVPVSKAKVFAYGATLWGVLTAMAGLLCGIVF